MAINLKDDFLLKYSFNLISVMLSMGHANIVVWTRMTLDNGWQMGLSSRRKKHKVIS